MIKLTGKNLGERHRDLNLKVIDAASKETNFNEVKENEQSDIDRLFKIDLASRYKNIAYILEILKSGDELYVSRALKCSWIYDDNLSDFISPTYLHDNIFPYMSQRMKKKMLTTISIHVKSQDRAVCFYSYCINSELQKLALKFLMSTAESFKMDLIKKLSNFDFDDTKCLKHFIGSSRALAAAYVEMFDESYSSVALHDLRFLYFKYNEDYLDLLEKYVKDDANYPDIYLRRFGIRISRDILKRHKNRVWNRVLFYTNKLNKSMLVKYFTYEDIKRLGPLLLPNTSSSFWDMDFYNSYRFILDLIPKTDIFYYLKKIFSSKYNESFEFKLNFYKLEYYKILTTQERESWALLHIEREEELFGRGKDYLWYQFVNFVTAFSGIKRYIFITPDNDERSEMVGVLVHAAKREGDLTTLLNYYYERHVNESETHKMRFIDKVVSEHDIYSFTAECWAPFNKLLYSLEIYSRFENEYSFKPYVARSMIYHILNKKDFSEGLTTYIEYERCFDDLSDIIKALSEERSYVVVKHWLEFFADKIRVLLEKPRDDKVKDDIEFEVHTVWMLMWSFGRSDEECPEIVLNYMKSNKYRYAYHFKAKFVPMTEGDFVRLLKIDKQMAIENISKVECNAYRWSFRLSRLFRKLKVYFTNDVSDDYLNYFLGYLESVKSFSYYRQIRMYRNVKIAVVCVFQLGSEELITSFLEEYIPANSKIDHDNIDIAVLQVQKAVCRLAYLSRTPVRFSSIRKYVTGDYVRFCLPIFNNYLVRLPMSSAFEFIDEIINSPVSIQKHGLRLAFKCFNAQDLSKVILRVWNKTKNVSLRLILYTSLFKRVVNDNGDSQKDLFEVLKRYTSELNQEDHEDVFDLLVSDYTPNNLLGEYIEVAWNTVSKLTNKNSNIVRKTRMITHMTNSIYSVKREFLRDQVINEHILTELKENKLKPSNGSQQVRDLVQAKWDLSATYIVRCYTNKEVNECDKLFEDILTTCLLTWDDKDRSNDSRQFCRKFLNTMHDATCVDRYSYANAYPIYQCTLRIFQQSLPKDQLYLPTWMLKASMISRLQIYAHHCSHHQCQDSYKYPCIVEIADAFATKIGKLVEKLVDKDEFFHSFYSETADNIRNVCETMARVMNVDENGFKILVSGHLTRFDPIETHVLAIMVIPKYPPKNWERRHANAVAMIKEFDDPEIHNKLFQKFDTFSPKNKKIV